MGRPSCQVSREPTGCSLTPPPGHYPAWQPAERGSGRERERETEKERHRVTITENEHLTLVIHSCINLYLPEVQTGLCEILRFCSFQ